MISLGFYCFIKHLLQIKFQLISGLKNTHNPRNHQLCRSSLHFKSWGTNWRTKYRKTKRHTRRGESTLNWVGGSTSIFFYNCGLRHSSTVGGWINFFYNWGLIHSSTVHIYSQFVIPIGRVVVMASFTSRGFQVTQRQHLYHKRLRN